MSNGLQLLNTIAGQATSTVYSIPTDPNINVPAKAVFGKFFNNMLSAFNGGPTGINLGSSQIQGLSGVTNPLALQAFNNARPQNLPFNTAQQYSNLQAPGTALLQPPSPQGNIAYQQSPYAAGVTGIQAPGQGINGVNQQPFLPGGPVGFGGIGLPNAGGGKFQMLLYPVLGLISVFKSVFGIRRLLSNGMTPVTINKDNLAFNRTNESYSEIDSEEGSFDEVTYPEENVSNTSWTQSDLQRLSEL